MDRPRTSSDKKDTGKLTKTEENPKRAAAKWLPEIMAKYPHAYTSDSSQLSSSEQRAEREGKNSTENRLPIHPDNRPHSDQYDNRQLREIENSKEKVRKWQGHIAHNQTQDKKHDMAVQDNPLSSLDSSDLSCGHSSQYIPREEWKLLKDQASKSESSDSESMSKVDLKQIYTDWYQGQSSSDSVSSVDDPLNADWQKSIQRETHARMNQGEAGPSRRNPSTIEISSSHDTDSQDVVQQLRNIWHQETRLDRTMHSLPQDTIESDAVEAVNFPSQTPANLLKKYLYKYSGGKADEIKQRKAFNKFYEEAQTISNEMRNNSARLQNTADSADAEKLRSREIITRLKQTLDDIKEIQERRKFDQNYHNRVKTETDRLNTQRGNSSKKKKIRYVRRLRKPVMIL